MIVSVKWSDDGHEYKIGIIKFLVLLGIDIEEDITEADIEAAAKAAVKQQ